MKNADGSPYRVAGSNRQYDPKNPEFDLFNLWDQEIIEIGGSPLLYYEVFIQNSTIDPIYREDRGKIFSNDPIQLYGLYEPIPSKNQMGAYGIDSPDEMIFQLNYRAVLKALGHMPKVGSRIHTPHLGEDWVIIQNGRGDFKMWGAMRLEIRAARFQENATTGEGRVTQKPETYKII